MTRLSILGERLVPLRAPSTDPTCEMDECDGEMRPTGQTVTIPMGGGTVALLKCERCRDGRWYLLSNAYALCGDIEF